MSTIQPAGRQSSGALKQPPAVAAPASAPRRMGRKRQRSFRVDNQARTGHEHPGREFALLGCLLLVLAWVIGDTFNSRGMSTGLCLIIGLLAWLLHLRCNHQSTIARLQADGRWEKLPRKERDAYRFGESIGWQRSRWIVTLLFGGALLFVRASGGLSESVNVLSFFVDALAHFALGISLGLWLFHARRGHPGMLACFMVIAMLSISAGAVSQSISGQVLGGLLTLFGFLLLSQHVLSRWPRASHHRKRRSSSPQPPVWLGKATLTATNRSNASDSSGASPRLKSATLFFVLAISSLLLSANVIGQWVGGVAPRLQQDFMERVFGTLDVITSKAFIGGTGFVRGSELGSVRNVMIESPNDPAIRALSPQTPGYVRGTVFDFYQNRLWRSASYRSFRSQEGASELLPRREGVFWERSGRSQSPEHQTIMLQQNSSEGMIGSIKMENLPHKGNLLFSTLNTQAVVALGTRVQVSHQSIVQGDIDLSQSYNLVVGRGPGKETLGPFRKKLLLWVDPEIREPLAPLASSICPGNLHPRVKAQLLARYFQDNFTYSLTHQFITGDNDPVVDFVLDQHPAHCEYFATATAMMLRCVDVPTRYVTGYVFTQMDDDDEYWLARNRDAHAWVEAYDDRSQQWFPVEATVGRTYIDYEIQQNRSSSGIAGSRQETESRSTMGTLEFLLSLVRFRTRDSLSFLFQTAQVPLFCLVGLLIWLRSRQRRRKGMSEADFLSQQMLRRVDRRMRRFSLVRAQNETLHQFASRLEAEISAQPQLESMLQSAAGWYRQFAGARYQGKVPQPYQG